MGLRLIAPDTVAPWWSPVVNPIGKDLLGWFEFDTDLSRFGVNRVRGAANGVRYGTPGVGAGYADFSGANVYIDTGIADRSEVTTIAVCRAASPIAGTSTATAAQYISSYADAKGILLYHLTDAQLNGTAWRDNGSGGATSASALMTDTPTDWGIRAQRVANPSGNKIDNLTSGGGGSQTFSGARLISDITFRIGYSGETVYTGGVHISHAVIYDGYLTDGELDTVAALMRARAARFGIVV